MTDLQDRQLLLVILKYDRITDPMLQEVIDILGDRDSAYSWIYQERAHLPREPIAGIKLFSWHLQQN